MNIKFLFDYLDAQETIVEADIEELHNKEVDSFDHQIGYLQAISDFRSYLKQAIELTKK